MTPRTLYMFSCGIHVPHSKWVSVIVYSIHMLSMLPKFFRGDIEWDQVALTNVESVSHTLPRYGFSY